MMATTLAKLLEHIATPRERYPVVRTGERAPIPQVVRLSVYIRDGFRCRFCGWGDAGAPLEIDHMLPWSAGGPDLSSNLRTLCPPCNQQRSNWNDGDHFPNLRPTTWWCFECWRHPDIEWPDLDYPQPSRHRTPWRNGVNLAAAPYATGTDEQVYCAWCWGYGFSDVWFGPGQQDRLAALANDPHAPPRTQPHTEPTTSEESHA